MAQSLTPQDPVQLSIGTMIIHRCESGVKTLLWQRKKESASFANFGFDPDPAAVQLHSLFNYRKPDAVTIGLVTRRKRLEHLEYLLEVLLVDSGPVIGNTESPGKVLFRTTWSRKSSAYRIGRFHQKRPWGPEVTTSRAFLCVFGRRILRIFFARADARKFLTGLTIPPMTGIISRLSGSVLCAAQMMVEILVGDKKDK